MKKAYWILMVVIIIGLLSSGLVTGSEWSGGATPTLAPTEYCGNSEGMPGCPTWTPSPTVEPYPMPGITPNPYPMDSSRLRPTYEVYLPVVNR